MNKQLIMVRGLPGSGKSTWAKQMLEMNPGHIKRVSKDDLRAMMDGSKWSKANEKFVLIARDAIVQNALAEGYSVIVDDTGFAPQHEIRLRELAAQGSAGFEIKDFTHVSLEECIERDRKRQNYVGEQVIRRMFCQYLMPKPAVHNEALHEAIICDLDGTLALKGNRSAYDWSRVGEDAVNEPIAEILRTYEERSPHPFILIVSGRSDICKDASVQWLDKHNIPYDAIYMRKDGDNRKDSIVKAEIYRDHIEHRYSVWFVLDDRSSVVNLWRCELGLTCLQVNYGDF